MGRKKKEAVEDTSTIPNLTDIEPILIKKKKTKTLKEGKKNLLIDVKKLLNEAQSYKLPLFKFELSSDENETHIIIVYEGEANNDHS